MVSVLVRTIGLGVEIAQQLVHEILSRNLRGRKAVACYAGVNRAKDLPVGVYMRDILGSASASAVDLGASVTRVLCAAVVAVLLRSTCERENGPSAIGALAIVLPLSENALRARARSMQTAAYRRGQQRSLVHTASSSDAWRRVDPRSGPEQQCTVPRWGTSVRADRRNPLRQDEGRSRPPRS